jgi:signal transduction histidine kinase
MILNVLLSVAVFLNLALSFFVISQNYRSLNNRFFSLLSFLSAVWTFTNFMTGFQAVPFWLESTYASGALVIGVGISWILVVIKKRVEKTWIVPIISCAVFFAAASYLPGFIARDYQQIYAGGVFVGDPGIGLIVYTVFFLCGSIFILWRLVHTWKNTALGESRDQLKSIFYGTLILVIISAFTSFIFPSLSIFTFSGLDSIGLLFFLFFVAYAITKQHLFNIKIIATELITFILWTFILIRAILAEDLQSMITEIGLLIVTIIVGILLIRSVLREVTQRERIELLAADLEKANVRLTELDRQKSEFVSFATHQLRAPLTAMKGYASLLLEGDMGEVSPTAKEGISRIFESTNTLVSIVDDYLNISRIELGTMKYAFETIDLKTLIEDTIAEIMPNIEKSKLAFVFRVDPPDNGTPVDYSITADRDKLKQVIGNLIDNSLKYTPSGSITVSLGTDRLRHRFIFKVSDTGVGIAPETLPHLFQKFSRAENANKTNIRGTGLGLYVARQMIEAHHGTIRAESLGEGKGSTFIVELEPLAKA